MGPGIVATRWGKGGEPWKGNRGDKVGKGGEAWKGLVAKRWGKVGRRGSEGLQEAIPPAGDTGELDHRRPIGV
jgi:hypothetical protein